MQVDQALALFDQYARLQPTAVEGLKIERLDKLVCLTGIYHFISHWQIDGHEAKDAVAAVVARYGGGKADLIWRIYQHDQPGHLGQILAAAGFVASPSGTLMMSEATSTVVLPNILGLCIEQVCTMQQLDDFFACSDLAFGPADHSRHKAAYCKDLNNPDHLLYVAYLNQRPVASARIVLGALFGQLFGGGVAPSFRGLGIYRALLAQRIAAAQARSIRYLSTEAADSSRPILEKLGFMPCGRETTWILPRKSALSPQARQPTSVSV